MSVQMKPPPGEKGPLYSPDRDVAHTFPSYLQATASALEQFSTNAEFKKQLEVWGITNYQIGEGLKALSDAYALVTEKPPIAVGPGEALVRAGFTKLPEEVKYLIFGLIGQFVWGAAYTGVREASTSSRPMASIDRIYEAVVEGRRVASMAFGVQVVGFNPGNKVPNGMQMAFEHAKEIADQTGDRLREARHESIRLTKENALLTAKLEVATKQEGRYDDLIQKLTADVVGLKLRIDYFKSTWLYKLLGWCLARGWNG